MTRCHNTKLFAMERYSRWETGSRLIANMDGDNKEIKEEVFCFLFWIVGGDHVDHGVRSVARARCHRNRNARLDARIDKRRVKRVVLHRVRVLSVGPLLLSPLWKRVPRPVFTDQL